MKTQKKTWPPFVSTNSTLRFRDNAGWIDVGSKYRWIDPLGKVRARAYKHGPPSDKEIMSDEEFQKRYIIRKNKRKPIRKYIKISKNSTSHVSRRKNPVFITDNNTLDLMTQLEGDFWKEEQITSYKHDPNRDIYGFYGNLKLYSEFLKKLKRVKNDEREWLMDMYGEVIYGSGGWNRYFIRGDGRVVFSKRHSGNEEKIKLAKTLGFDVE